MEERGDKRTHSKISIRNAARTVAIHVCDYDTHYYRGYIRCNICGDCWIDKENKRNERG